MRKNATKNSQLNCKYFARRQKKTEKMKQHSKSLYTQKIKMKGKRKKKHKKRGKMQSYRCIPKTNNTLSNILSHNNYKQSKKQNSTIV